MVKVWTGGNAGLNQHLFKVTSDVYDKWFYYLWTSYHLKRFQVIARDKATTMGHIKRSHLKEALTLVPDSSTYCEMSKLMNPIIEMIVNLGVQNRTLAQIRDTLLPKLMSGEIDVSNIKIDSEEIGHV
jgi:type I restriction enzyme S subunit